MERLEPETHDITFVDELMQEGHSYSEALIIATTEMEGAAELKNGGIHARQTHCRELQYNENITESRGMREGRKITTKAVEEWLKANNFSTLEEYYNSLEC